MQERHANRKKYFDEQALTTRRYVIPYIDAVFPIQSHHRVLEVGCGEGGNLVPFIEAGCEAVGVDLGEERIENAKSFLSSLSGGKWQVIAEDIYDVTLDQVGQFDLIFLRDVIEHIPNQEKFLESIKPFLKEGGIIFFGFPPWRMPFGGHQQICKNKRLSNLPYLHLLPYKAYEKVLRMAGESDATIESLLEIKDTGISISRFRRAYKAAGYRALKETQYLINPNYETKFNLKKRELWKPFRIGKISDFYTTALYSIITPVK